MKSRFALIVKIAKIISPAVGTGFILAIAKKLYNFLMNQDITTIKVIAFMLMFITLLLCATFITNAVIKYKKETKIKHDKYKTRLRAIQAKEDGKTRRIELTVGKQQKNSNHSPNNPPPTPSTLSANAVGYTNIDARAEDDIEKDEQNSSAQQRKSKVIPLSSFNSYKKGATKN